MGFAVFDAPPALLKGFKAFYQELSLTPLRAASQEAALFAEPYRQRNTKARKQRMFLRFRALPIKTKRCSRHL